MKSPILHNSRACFWFIATVGEVKKEQTAIKQSSAFYFCFCDALQPWVTSVPTFTLKKIAYLMLKIYDFGDF